MYVPMKPEVFFKALSDPTRLRSLLLLLGERQLCVCELVEALELGQPLVSRHLGQLREQGIVVGQRRGQWVYYRLHPALPGWCREVLEQALDAKEVQTALASARRRLAAMATRPAPGCTPGHALDQLQ